jgi:hypothetical protein
MVSQCGRAVQLSLITGGCPAAQSAEVLKYNFKVPCADAFVSSLTYEPGCRTSQDQATLVTTDLDFKEETHS